MESDLSLNDKSLIIKKDSIEFGRKTPIKKGS